MKAKYLIWFLLIFNTCFSQKIKLPIDSITQKVIYARSVIDSKNLSLIIKKWINNQFQVPISDIKSDNNNIKFIVSTDFTKLRIGKNEKIAGEILFTIQIKVDSIGASIIISNIKLHEIDQNDSIPIENYFLTENSKFEINKNYIIKQIDDHIQILLDSFEYQITGKYSRMNNVNAEIMQSRRMQQKNISFGESAGIVFGMELLTVMSFTAIGALLGSIQPQGDYLPPAFIYGLLGFFVGIPSGFVFGAIIIQVERKKSKNYSTNNFIFENKNDSKIKFRKNVTLIVSPQMIKLCYNF